MNMISGLMNSNRQGRLPAWIALPALLAALLLGGCISFEGGPKPEFREVLLQGSGNDKFLLIDIDGPITNNPMLIPNVGVLPGMTARVRQELELAYDDSNIRGILLRINSPGGTLTDSDIIYHSLMEFKRTKKVKIIASMGDIAASGAVYIAMAADEIYAHPTTITGSIGVILPHMEFSGLMEKLGIKSDPVTTGPYKDIGSEFRPPTKEERRLIQEMIDSQFQHFLTVVKKGRPRMSGQEVEKMADGRIITAQEAQKRGLIDQVGYLDNAYKRLTDLAGFPEASLVRYANSWMTGSNIYSNTFPIEFFEF
ncbi:MAG: signal peptide peptidase SppA [Deltaproteobacteria bacterium]|nr:signal peptide peptidase SppA [Deltaproteobacteria bacterium]